MVPEKVKERPAEIGGGLAGAIAFLIGKGFNLDDDTVLALTLVVGAVPGCITWAVDRFRKPAAD